MSLIKIKNASLGYEGKTVVNDISVDIKEKDYICIVGENGSGKTTLMKALLGLLKPLSGSITYSDGLKQNEIGYLPQSSDIQRDFPASVQEVVLSGCLNKKHTFFYQWKHYFLYEVPIHLIIQSGTHYQCCKYFFRNI